MAQKTLGLAAVAAATAGIGAKYADLPSAFAGLLSVAVLGAALVGDKLIPKREASPLTEEELAAMDNKQSKKAKKSQRKAEADAEAAADAAERAAAKAQKKREKERARKDAKRAEADAKAKADAEEAKATEQKATTAGDKKKKKKKKAKKAAEPKPEEEEEAAAAEPVQDDWEEVKMKKGKAKKVDDDDSDSGHSAPAHQLALYVDRKHFPAILGSKGSTLRTISEVTGTKIELPKEGKMTTDIVIEGSVEGCNAAKKAIKQLVAKGYSEITDPGKIDTAISVPENKRSVLVGPGGRNIKMIQAKTGARINLPERGSEDKVTIVGESEAVAAATRAINQLVSQGYSDLTHENYISAGIEVSRDLLSTLIGPGGSTIRGLQDSTKCRITVPSDKDSETVHVTLLGEPEAIADCRAQLAVLLAPPPPVPIAEEWTQQASLMHLDQW